MQKLLKLTTVEKLLPCNCQTCQNYQKPYFHQLNNLRKLLNNNKPESQCQESGDMVNIYSLIDDTIGREQLNRSTQSKYTLALLD